jgi:DNA gyrase/topoisomerase IV subunit A
MPCGNINKLRKLEVKIRDLENSREEWKERAKKAEKELEKREEDFKEAIKEAKKGEPLVEIKAKGHHYSVKVIKISIKRIGSIKRGRELLNLPRPTKEIKIGIVPNQHRKGLNIFSSSNPVREIGKKTNAQFTSRSN